MVGWQACASAPVDWMQWIECRPGTAAWVQAVFSIIGIFVAIAVPFFIWRIENRQRAIDRFRRSENLLHSLTGDVLPFFAEVAILRQSLRDDPPDTPRDESEWYRWFAGAALNIPKPLENAMPLTHDMERRLVDPLRDVCSAAKTHNAYLWLFRGTSRECRFDDWAEIQVRIRDNVELVAFCATKVMALYSEGNALKEMIASAGLDDVKEPQPHTAS